MNQTDSTLDLLRHLGWDEKLLAEVERHNRDVCFGLKVESPIRPTSIDEAEIGTLPWRSVFTTELIVNAG